MEITFESRLRRNEQLVRPDGTKKDTGETSAPGIQPQTDRVSSAQEAVRQAVEQLDAQSQRLAALAQQDRQTEKKTYIWDILDGEEKDSEADALGEQMKTMERCHKIAARIMRGDKVPPQDEQYLMMNDPDGYKLAMAMRTPKKHPKKHESVLKDEDKTSRSDSESGGEDAVSSCEESGGTSDAGGDSTAGE
ncbi:MAG: hypothetical protein HDT15_10320 [Oscillibacter sp.]|nr:hypothetical protein [Oscillibacter sp.]